MGILRACQPGSGLVGRSSSLAGCLQEVYVKMKDGEVSIMEAQSMAPY